MNTYILEKHIMTLSQGYRIEVSRDYRVVVARKFRLPPGWNRKSTDVLIEIPDSYPSAVPGRDSSIFIERGLRFHGRTPADYREGWGNLTDWAWICYEALSWDPHRDNLYTLLEMLRADLTNPLTEE